MFHRILFLHLIRDSHSEFGGSAVSEVSIPFLFLFLFILLIISLSFLSHPYYSPPLPLSSHPPQPHPSLSRPSHTLLTHPHLLLYLFPFSTLHLFIHSNNPFTTTCPSLSITPSSPSFSRLLPSNSSQLHLLHIKRVCILIQFTSSMMLTPFSSSLSSSHNLLHSSHNPSAWHSPSQIQIPCYHCICNTFIPLLFSPLYRYPSVLFMPLLKPSNVRRWTWILCWRRWPIFPFPTSDTSPESVVGSRFIAMLC